MSPQNGPYPASFWAATASEPPVANAPLPQNAEADIVIIGAGFTGLSAAYHLAASGRDCLVLEAQEVGWGASGRNGGMVVPRYKHTFPALAARYGVPTARVMHAAVHRAVDLIEQIVTTERIACAFARCGHLTPYVHAADAARFAADAEWLAREAGDAAPQILNHDETALRIGTPFYAGAYFEPRGGEIHPLRFAQGLARAVLSRGGRVCTHTAVRTWSRQGAHIAVETNRGTIRAGKLVIATNGYTDTERAGEALARRIVPVVSSLIATAPLPDDQRRGLLPKRNVVTDAKRLTNYFRVSADGRLVFGGRGGASNRESAGVYRRLAKEMAAIFPQLRDAPVDYRWSGRVAVTLDGLPHIGRLEEGVSYAVGYNGRGVALSVLLGSMLATDAAGPRDPSWPDTPAPLAAALAPIPFHALQVPGKKIVTTWYRMLDALGL